MSRMKLSTGPERSEEDVIEELRKTLVEFAEVNSTKNSYNRQATELSNLIKAIMAEEDISVFPFSDSQEATLTVYPRYDFNELQAIEILKDTLAEENPEALKDIVRTQEYIDEDALNSAFFSGVIEKDLLNSCNTEKDPTSTLRIRKRRD